LGVIDRFFRLTNEPGGLGLSCSATGLSLAGVPLLRKSEAGFVPRSTAEIEALVEAAFGGGRDAADLLPGFGAVARALNRGDVAHAMIAAVLTRLPELSWDEAARLADADDQLRKYNPDEPRDAHGCWTSDAGADMSGQDRLPEYPVDFGPEDDDAEPPDDRSPLEIKYDDLGPVEFSKQAIQFGDWLARKGKNLDPEEWQNALSEYNFLQNRVTFWQAYPDKPLEAGANINSAAIFLFEGAVASGMFVPGSKHGDFPQSMVTAAVGAMALDDSQPGLPVRGRSSGTGFEPESVTPEGQTPAGRLRGDHLTPYDDMGGVADNAKAKINWAAPIKERGLQQEQYLADDLPGVIVLEKDTTAFDLYDQPSRGAISAKTLDPLCYSYVKDPRRIYYKIKGYINDAADYDEPIKWFDLDPSEIDSRSIHLGIRDYISSAQWQQLNRAVRYGKSRGVSVVITRIRD
jgi:hypothetical protein